MPSKRFTNVYESVLLNRLLVDNRRTCSKGEHREAEPVFPTSGP